MLAGVTTAFDAHACFRGGAHPGCAVARLRTDLARPLVFTYGIFDVLDAGHLLSFEEARRHGRSLVVGVRGDGSARRLRPGTWRPIHRALDRVRMVAALAPVSAVVLFDEEQPLALMCALRPEVCVMRGDDVAAESALLAEWGGRAVCIPQLAPCGPALPAVAQAFHRERWHE